MTFIQPGEADPVAGELHEGRAVAFGSGTVLDRIASGDSEPAAAQSWPLDEVTLCAPIPQPRHIFCVGLNYAAHAAEGGQEPPEVPAIFTKPGTASAAPAGPVICPPVVRRLDYEAELAVVVGPERSIAGYAVADDISARDLQKRERHWTRAKGADSFCPWGPWITTADQVTAPEDLRIQAWVNGEPRQDSSTADMIFTPAQVIEFLAETCSLLPGDLILTGTPSGVGYAMDPPQFLAAGDRVRIEVEGLGWIEHPVTAG